MLNNSITVLASMKLEHSQITKPKEKILFVIHSFMVGGAEMFLANLLNSLDRNKFDKLVVALSGEGPVEQKLQTDKVIHLPRRWKFDISPRTKLTRIIDENSIHKIFVLGPFSYFFARLALFSSQSSAMIYVCIQTTKPRSLKNFMHYWLFGRLVRDKIK